MLKYVIIIIILVVIFYFIFQVHLLVHLLVDGFRYQTYGGERAFELFAYGSLIMGIFHVIFIKLNNRSINMKTTK